MIEDFYFDQCEFLFEYGDGYFSGYPNGNGYGNGRWNGFYSKEPFHTGSGHDIYYACYPDEIIIGKVD